jgi:LmbE family N-acetylglucosaminyl deacetylase
VIAESLPDERPRAPQRPSVEAGMSRTPDRLAAGRRTLHPGSRLLVISPHLDDAILSCGALLAAHREALVVTIFAGTPRDARMCTDRDARSGFRDAAHAIAARRREDTRALAEVEAQPRWLGFCDDQYDEPASLVEVAAAVGALLDAHRERALLYPLGLFNHDHLLAHDATAAALETRPSRCAFVYEDVPYRAHPGLLQERLAGILGTGRVASPAVATDAPACREAKARAVAAYVSQRRLLGREGLDDASLPERLWTIVPQEQND